MRLSEILKEEHGSHPPRVVPSAPKVRTPDEFLPPTPSKLSTPTKPQAPASFLEKAIREKLENEFQSKIETMRKQIEEGLQVKLDEERKRLQLREAELKFEAQKLELQAQQMRMEKDFFHEFQKRMEGQVMDQMKLERLRLESGFSQEIEAARKNLEEMRRLISLKEEEIRMLRQTPATPRVQSPLQPQPQAQAPVPPLSPVAEKIESSPPVTETRPLSTPAFVHDQPLPVSASQPPALREEKPNPVPKETPPLPPINYQVSAEWEQKAKALCGEMIQSGNEVFEQCSTQAGLDLSRLKLVLTKLIENITEREAEYLALSIEPYPPEANPFICHAVNTTILSLILSLEFELSPDEKMDLALASFLHDIGLLNVQEDLNYPKQLTPQLQQEILNHPTKGCEILRDYLNPASIEGILGHHEVSNGKGYPKGLSGQEIHLFAHIIHVSDSFEALVHERPYRRQPLEVNEAMKQLIDTGRAIYERAVLKALMVRIGLYPVMTFVELNNKKIARVIRQNREFPLSPMIQIEYDETGGKLKQPQVIDLSATQFIHIIGPTKKQMVDYSKSQFAAAEPEPDQQNMTEVLKNMIPIALILAVLLVLLYAIIKI